MSLLPPRQPTESPAYNGCTCQCHYVPGIKHVMPCCYPETPVVIAPPPVFSEPVMMAPTPVIVVTEPVVVPGVAFTAEPKSDRQLLRELFYASDTTGRRVEEVLLTMGLETLWREVYERLERHR